MWVCDNDVCERWCVTKMCVEDGVRATPATQNEGRCHQVPRLPRNAKADVTKCHACHTNGRNDHGAKREPSASPEPAQCHKCHTCHAKQRSMSPSATLATQNDGGCRQVPRLPRKQRRRPRRQTGTKRVTRASPVPRLPRKAKVDVTKWHACHAKRGSMSPSATLICVWVSDLCVCGCE